VLANSAAGMMIRRLTTKFARMDGSCNGWYGMVWSPGLGACSSVGRVWVVMHQGVGNTQVGKQSAKKATKGKFGAIPGWCPPPRLASHETKIRRLRDSKSERAREEEEEEVVGGGGRHWNNAATIMHRQTPIVVGRMSVRGASAQRIYYVGYAI
jgi:hypothetical protein